MDEAVRSSESGSVAYHLVTQALELEPSRSAAALFAANVGFALNGHVPYWRHHAAGLGWRQARRGEDALERCVREQLALDLNPITVAARQARDLPRFLAGFNHYNQTVQLGVRTVTQGHPASLQRLAVAAQVDPVHCQHATQSLLGALVQQVQRNGTNPQAVPSGAGLLQVSTLLGLEQTAAHDVCLALQERQDQSIREMARSLGCHVRTLERNLRKFHLTAESMRRVARLHRALDGIRLGDALVQVAGDCGYSDQSHMTREFRGACGMPPSFFVRLFQAGQASRTVD